MTADASTSLPTPSPAGDVRTVRLASAIDFAGFRRACRALWAEQVVPERVVWHCADDAEGDLFEAPSAGATASQAPPVHVPPSFLPLAESAVLHRDPERFALLYRLLWRLQLEPGLRGNPLDPDWQRADAMSQEVRRDLHAMQSSVRLRPIAEPDGDGAIGAPLHVAWFEPEHHIVEAVAPFFARRFQAMRWAILTPERSVGWDGVALAFAPGVRRDEVPVADADDRIWLSTYRSVFRPGRVKL
ncbi:MAG TPA: TIGR03915 family putative DNA repair protein, partial [Caldimonas sp.]|nr:TIGR03915 family putative DNA repair protein [Caldimonas sp.]